MCLDKPARYGADIAMVEASEYGPFALFLPSHWFGISHLDSKFGSGIGVGIQDSHDHSLHLAEILPLSFLFSLK